MKVIRLYSKDMNVKNDELCSFKDILERCQFLGSFELFWNVGRLIVEEGFYEIFCLMLKLEENYFSNITDLDLSKCVSSSEDVVFRDNGNKLLSIRKAVFSNVGYIVHENGMTSVWDVES